MMFVVYSYSVQLKKKDGHCPPWIFGRAPSLYWIHVIMPTAKIGAGE